MAKREIVKIDESKCNGCGDCVTACAENAIEIIDGKAKLVSEIYCDGLGACLGHCPMDAISIEERDAEEFDEEATNERIKAQENAKKRPSGGGCPGMMAQMFQGKRGDSEQRDGDTSSQLAQWPVQLALVSPNAEYFKNSDLVLAADCVAFAMGNFHSEILKDHSLAIACPKLDNTGPYVDKLAEIIRQNDLNSLSVLHMQVPCCSGLTRLAKQAVEASGKDMKFDDVTVSLHGEVLERTTM
ncbi:Ferredoxin III [Anaerohalosphaera lusitana]|uniref:Ferredoxin III n=1 Tax=Anaerohalosphaera lusitana TaxID=1936003 RepID=A0A1U9NPD5_9BACT|nr:4Fe-4S dicluster domain-containing protein [Anaerohalosphaera lusitana]AQT69470.1 Ferredoxin III [Anaerohalosphaera lusitana]